MMSSASSSPRPGACGTSRRSWAWLVHYLAVFILNAGLLITLLLLEFDPAYAVGITVTLSGLAAATTSRTRLSFSGFPPVLPAGA
ncbi:hypothetical protein [Amycolatopsis sp. 195334CR]|uniref:hypothetical protein n=1 Tax=Amycolatopsis sp. 195334CR TaxID=2814588 RepID=UPI001A8D6956|nr:hypothetical protein [Amycolatopsis sp. 195334CR]MBN6040032.1 hypothetical protein [Amycolatopsis sp. 195334CR]